MKILKVIVKGYQQFRDLELDFTHPETGKPLEKICFIGRNGTGKSTILDLLYGVLSQNGTYIRDEGLIVLKLELEETREIRYYVHSQSWTMAYNQRIEESRDWINDLANLSQTGQQWLDFVRNSLNNKYAPFITSIADIRNQEKSQYAQIIYAPADSQTNYLFKDLSDTNLGEAEHLRNGIPLAHIISPDTVSDFWKTVIYQTLKREASFQEYAEKNESLTYKELKERFNAKHPQILKELAELWNMILDKNGLFFDYESAKLPMQLTDNLEAYIKKKTKDALPPDFSEILPEEEMYVHTVIPYNKLSTGIRNFIFKIGHIYSLFFNREIKWGFLLVDEPENSLFPDFLYDLIDKVYCKILEGQNTQFFTATHNPIIATQFEPYERIVLDLDEQGYVVARKGKTPAGDDPNDILLVDFQMRNLMTRAGLQRYKDYQELRRKLRKTNDPEVKQDLLKRMAIIQHDYNYNLPTE